MNKKFITNLHIEFPISFTLDKIHEERNRVIFTFGLQEILNKNEVKDLEVYFERAINIESEKQQITLFLIVLDSEIRKEVIDKYSKYIGASYEELKKSSMGILII